VGTCTGFRALQRGSPRLDAPRAAPTKAPSLHPRTTLPPSLYLRLQRLYREQADAHVAAVAARVRRLLEAAGRPGDAIPAAAVRNFCRNARNLRLVR
jgi:hypothetical protein